MRALFSLPCTVASAQTFPSPSRYPKPPAYTISNSFSFKEPGDDAQQYLDPASIRAQPLYGLIRNMHTHHKHTHAYIHTYLYSFKAVANPKHLWLVCLLMLDPSPLHLLSLHHLHMFLWLHMWSCIHCISIPHDIPTCRNLQVMCYENNTGSVWHVYTENTVHGNHLFLGLHLFQLFLEAISDLL